MSARLASLLPAALLAVLVSLTPALAIEPDEILSDPAMEERARQISKGLRCVVCRNQSIDDSDAGIARDMRLVVRERLVAGDTDDAVREHIVSRYGEFVLMRPAFGAHTVLLWATPALLLAIGAIVLVRRRAAAEESDCLSDDEERALAEALERN